MRGYGKLKTIKRECSVEFEEKKSKFIASVKPVFSKEEAEEYINYIKSLHPNATHNCSAYKINNKGLEFLRLMMMVSQVEQLVNLWEIS